MSQIARSFLLLLFISMPVAAQRFPYHDPDLIEKLYKNDYQHVGNDNLSRQDLIGVIAAFGLPDDPKKKCDLVADQSSQAGFAKLAKYYSFLQSDFRTGQYPSQEAKELAFVSVLFPDPPYVYILDPNLTAMAREIEKGGCKSSRVEAIRRNLVQILDDRIAGRNIPVTAAAPRTGPQTQPQVGTPQTRPGAQPPTPVARAPQPPAPQPTAPPVRTAPPAPQPPQPPPVDASGVPPGTRIGVTTLEPIDLLNPGENRTYRGKVQRDVQSGGRTVFVMGAEVLLKLSRDSTQPNIVMFSITAVSVVVDGKPVALTTTTPFKTAAPIVPNLPKLELPAGFGMALTVQEVH
jgi:hypothetical protein